MPVIARPAVAIAFAPCLILWAALGCDSSAASRPPTLPEAAAAQAALQRALDAWQTGRRDSGGLIGAGPAVGVVDTLRPERPLIGFAILGPTGDDGPARTFAVRLQLDEPAEAVDASYLVIGQDPLWVFRREDYDLILHWEHKMPATPTPAEPAASPR